MRKRRRLWTLSEYVQLTEVLLLPAVRTSREALKELHRRHVCEDLQSADDVKRALRNLKKKNLANIGTGFDAPPSADPQGVIRIAEYQLRVVEEDDRQSAQGHPCQSGQAGRLRAARPGLPGR